MYDKGIIIVVVCVYFVWVCDVVKVFKVVGCNIFVVLVVIGFLVG